MPTLEWKPLSAADMTDNERLSVIERITDLYCRECGAARPCYCCCDE